VIPGVLLARNELPKSVRDLVEQWIHSAADVDTLLLLHRDYGPWTGATVARELRIDEDQATEILARLHRRGLLASEAGSFCFHPRDPAMADAVATLAQLFPAYRVAIVALIYARPTGPITDFSNAFRVRSEG
jgi:hypothetical protein